MGTKNKILLKGISQLWGKGGQHFPEIVNGHHSVNFRHQILDNKELSPIEYFQYNAVESEVYHEKFIIHDLNENVMECVKCHDTSHILEPCNNCGSKTDLILNWQTGGELFCDKCKREHQQTRWICSKCSCDNSITNTLYHWVDLEILPKGKEGCFIATACYGDYDSPEVKVLRSFRDNVLIKNKVGTLMVSWYYMLSPTLVKIIGNSKLLKYLIREYFLASIVAIITKKNK